MLARDAKRMPGDGRRMWRNSDYFIASADGRPIAMFDWFAIPAAVLPVGNQEVEMILHVEGVRQ
jgi:hypothetical protein